MTAPIHRARLDHLRQRVRTLWAAVLGCVLLSVPSLAPAASLELISSEGFGDTTSAVTGVSGAGITVYIRFQRLVSGPSRIGDISVSLSPDDFSEPLAYYSGPMIGDGAYAVHDVPGNEPNLELAVTLDVNNNAGQVTKLYRYFVPAANTSLRGSLNPYPGTGYSGVWGYSSGGTALAILGQRDGTVFINATNPAAPTQVYRLDGDRALFRDIKTYDDFAYVVCDGCDDGLQVVNLSNPLAPVPLPAITTHFKSAHALWIDQDLGYLFVLGSLRDWDEPEAVHDGMQVFDLGASKTDPPLVYTFDDFYINDFYSQDGIGYAADYFNGSLVTMDLASLPDSVPVLDSIVTEGLYVSNVWATEDGSYALATDEVWGGGLSIVDVTDKADVSIVGRYTLERDPAATVRKVSMRGSVAFVSWYRAGLEIVDFTVPTRPRTIGFYDTFPDNGTGFEGAWSNYSPADSGLVYVADMSTGLSIVELDPGFGIVQGTVTEAGSGLPVPDVLVEIASEDVRATTDASGVFRVPVDPGTHTVEYRVFGYVSDDLSVNVTLGNTTSGNIALDAIPRGAVAGFVLSSGEGVAGATVQLDDTPLSTTSGADGAYTLSDVPEGSYTLNAGLSGFGANDTSIAVSEGSTTNQNLALEPSAIYATMESAPDWTIGDGAGAGLWVRVEPLGTYTGGNRRVQAETDNTTDPGALCFVTGQGQSPARIGDNDVDHGSTTLLSGIFDLSGFADPRVRFYRWYVNNGNGVRDDRFRVDVSSNGGASWVNLETVKDTRRLWEKVDLRLSDFVTPSSGVRFRFVADDSATPSIVEAGIDDFEIY